MAKDIEAIKTIIDVGRDHIVGQFEWAIFIFTFVGWVLLSIAIIMLLFIIWERFHSVPVKLKTIGIKEEVRENKDREEDQPKTYILYTPEFEIISGEFIGKTSFSVTSTSVNDHNIGENIDGYYSSKSGRIESNKTTKTGYQILAIFTSLGLLLAYALPIFMRSSIAF